MSGETEIETRELAQKQAKRWRVNPYYENAEQRMASQWRDLIHPFIDGVDFRITVDLAAGHGRNAEHILPLCEKLFIVDINKENIEFCRERFRGRDENINFIVNDGIGLKEINKDEATLFYCFDAMVHFDSDVVRMYLREARRILCSGGHGFCHHSNSTSDPGGTDLKRHVRGRNFMTKELFEHYCVKEGLVVEKTAIIDWGGEMALDCLTLFRKP